MPVKSPTSERNTIVRSATSKPDQSGKTLNTDREEADTIATLKFKELTISIGRLDFYDKERKLDQLQNDTVEIYTEPGQTAEQQLISVSNNQLTGLKVEQRYETSITIMNEGPHCDLINWKHYYSDWKELKTNKRGQFITAKYSEKEAERFPEISIDELKAKVKEQCGDEWLELLKNVKSPTEYPSGVGISRYYLRVIGKKKDTGENGDKADNHRNTNGLLINLL